MRDPSKHLNLWKKRLGRVPESVWEQRELESLVLADNELSEVSEKIGWLKKLRMLDLGHYELPSLGGEITESTKPSCRRFCRRREHIRKPRFCASGAYGAVSGF